MKGRRERMYTGWVKQRRGEDEREDERGRSIRSVYTKDIGLYVIRCIATRPQTSYCSSRRSVSPPPSLPLPPFIHSMGAISWRVIPIILEISMVDSDHSRLIANYKHWFSFFFPLQRILFSLFILCKACFYHIFSCYF